MMHSWSWASVHMHIIKGAAAEDQAPFIRSRLTRAIVVASDESSPDDQFRCCPFQRLVRDAMRQPLHLELGKAF